MSDIPLSVEDIDDFSDECKSSGDGVSSLLELLLENEAATQQHTLGTHNLRFQRKLCDTLQGELLLAEAVDASAIHGVERGERVAVKKVELIRIRERLAHRDNFSFVVDEDLYSEHRIYQQLRLHSVPHVTRLVDFFTDDCHVYLVTKYVNQTTMRDYIRRSHPDVDTNRSSLQTYIETVMRCMSQLCKTLNTLHSTLHCCHLDICAENILVDSAEDRDQQGVSIALCDFGVAQLFRGNPVSFDCDKFRLNIDNGAFHAPEVFDGKTFDASAADVWAFGMLMFECLAGRPLYTPEQRYKVSHAYAAIVGGDLDAYLKKHVCSELISDAARSLMCRCLKHDEANRISIRQAVQHVCFYSA